MSKAALAKAGGLEPLVEYLADDYEMGGAWRRLVIVWSFVVKWWRLRCRRTGLRGFRDHQLRWARSTRDSRKLGYVGLGITYALPWAVMTCVASGFALWSFSLLSVVAAGAGGGGAVGGGRGAGRWPGAARSLAAAAAGFLRAGVLGVEFCRGYGGLAWGDVPAAGWADHSGCVSWGPPPLPLRGYFGSKILGFSGLQRDGVCKILKVKGLLAKYLFSVSCGELCGVGSGSLCFFIYVSSISVGV